jgi:hypothetical protein
MEESIIGRTQNIMIYQARLAAYVATLAALAGCSTTTTVDSGTPSSGSAGEGLSGTQEQFNRMTNPCIAQASRMTGLSQGSIVVIDRIRTGGGPLLTLNAGGTKYSCRLEDDGSVTVFSEFAG